MKTVSDTAYMPAAPVVPVAIAAADRDPTIGPVMALVDTGADGTLIPADLITRLGVPVEYNTNVRGHVSAATQRAAVHVVDLLIGDARVPAIEVVSDEWGSDVILGRNVLNRFQIHLDGPAQTTELAE